MGDTIKKYENIVIKAITPSNQFDLTVNSDEIMPNGLPLNCTAHIIDMMKVAVSDGEDHWYLEPDKLFDAGQPWSVMFVEQQSVDV